jgi:molybdenum cofactor cytidylyltransferase
MGLMSHESEAKSVRIVAPVEGLLLAAGLSTRMGDFKLTLPWDGTTVIGRVTQTLREAGLADILVVTGHRSDDVVRALAGKAVRTVHNPEYGTGEMLTSVQVGLRALQPNTVAALLCLGDQPQMEVTTVLAVLEAGIEDRWQRVVVPSYRKRAGHPILLPRGLWPAVWKTRGTLRNVLTESGIAIRYINVDTATILADLDTPSDYRENRS